MNKKCIIYAYTDKLIHPLSMGSIESLIGLAIQRANEHGYKVEGVIVDEANPLQTNLTNYLENSPTIKTICSQSFMQTKTFFNQTNINLIKKHQITVIQ